jgi:sugar lactone lactonase YvrE
LSAEIGPAEVHFEASALLGEGPVWDDTRNELLWVDIERCEVHSLDEAGRHDVATLKESVGAAVPLRTGDGWIVGLRGGVGIVSRDGTVRERRAIDEERVAHRMNDGACDSMGRFWTGTMHESPGPPSDALYQVGPDLVPIKRIDGVGLSNGISWSPDDRWMYHVDSAAGTVSKYPFDLKTGSVGDRYPLIAIDPSDGEPDGITTDTEGGIWVALWDGWRIRRYLPTGELDNEIGLPVSRVTSCAFGGPAHSTLYITSARVGLSMNELERQESAGHIFRVETPFMGTRTHHFRSAYDLHV